MRCIRNVGATILYKRALSSRALDDIAKELVDFNWSSFYLETNIQLQANIFYELIFRLVDKYAPLVMCKRKNNDRPWVTSYFKEIVHKRDVAYKNGCIVS